MPSDVAVNAVARELYVAPMRGDRAKAVESWTWLPAASKRQWLEEARRLLVLAEEADLKEGS